MIAPPPGLLREAVRQAVILHPIPKGGGMNRPEGELRTSVHALLARIREVREGGIPGLAASLSGRELRLLVVEIAWIEDELLIDRVCRVLALRPRPSLAAAAWGLLGIHCDRPGVIELLKDADRTNEQLGLPDLPHPLVNAAYIARSLAESYLASSQDWESFSRALRALSPRTDPANWHEIALGQRILEEVSRRAPAEVVGREPRSVLALWLGCLPQESVCALGFAYLETLSPDRTRDDDPVLEAILRRLGRPDENRNAWVSASEGAERNFCFWINCIWLREAFDDVGEHERFRFWRKFAADFTPDKRSTAIVKIFHFHGFTVVEFLEVGNAAYTYTRENFDRILRLAGRRWKERPSDLKDRAKLLHDGQGELRILHNSGWEVPWQRRITNLITEHRRPRQARA